MDNETAFLCGLLELQYNQDPSSELRRISSTIPWAKGWPEDPISFWNAEAFMWQHKIEKEKRDLISHELSSLQGGKNLDLGCGSYSYIPSIGFDLSPKMLNFNENCQEKILGNVEQQLPFVAASFDSVTAVFLLNYVQNYPRLFSEIQRILKTNGIFVMVLAPLVGEWQRQKEVNSFSKEHWEKLLEKYFTITVVEKEGIFFFKGLMKKKK